VIYADTSFLFSFYAWDSNTQVAGDTYASDQRRPLVFTRWQELELRNVVRLITGRFLAAKQPAPFQMGHVFREVREDLKEGRLRYTEIDYSDAFRVAESLSAQFTQGTQAGSVDVWHVATAILIEADCFWTFDGAQFELAKRSGRFRRVPKLASP
jgi:hypothetical protein